MKREEITHNKLRWINIVTPNQKSLEQLQSEFDFHALDLEDVLSKYQFPKIDAYPDYLFIILQFPVYREKRQMYLRTELDIFFGKNYLITINSGKQNHLQSIFKSVRQNAKTREKFMGRGVALLLYEVVDALFTDLFPVINEKYETIFELEKEIFDTSHHKDMIQEIMILKRNIINIRRILSPQRQVLVNLESKYKKFIPEELGIYYDDVVDKIDKIVNQLDTAGAYADVLEDANENIISRSTNRVIKILTIFSVILLPLTLVTSYYGMNVPLPLQDDAKALFYINAILIALVIVMLWFFARKRWL